MPERIATSPPSRQQLTSTDMKRTLSHDPEMPPTPEEYNDNDVPTNTPHDTNCKHDDENHTAIRLSRISGGSKAVAPFLARHIPDQYAPQGGAEGDAYMSSLDGDSLQDNKTKPNTKFCYRHRPDAKCRRTVDEARMENLQKELSAQSQHDQQAISLCWSVYSAAPAATRKIFLDGILAMSCFPQLSYLTSGLKELIKIDFIAALPTELSFKILQHLDTVSLCNAAQVSRKWRELADDDTTWHHMCEQHINRKCIKCGWGLPILERKRLKEYIREVNGKSKAKSKSEEEVDAVLQTIEPLRHKKRAADEDISSSADKRPCTERLVIERSAIPRPQTRSWKGVYRERFEVGSNWEKFRCKERVIKAHDNGVMCLQFDDNILATGSYDTTIKIWNIKTGQHIKTLAGHTAGIRTLQFNGKVLISGSLDKTTKIWDLPSGECKKTIPNTDGILSLNFEEELCVTGSKDHTITVFNNSKTCSEKSFVLRGHTDWVNHVKLDLASRTVFSASDDGTCKLWDLDTKHCIRTYKGHTGQVQQILPLSADFELESEETVYDNDAVSTSSFDSGIPDVIEGARENYGHGFESSTSRPLPPRYMLTGSLDNTLRLWDTSSGRTLRKFFGHLEGVWALAADSLRVISGAEDRMVKIWDIQTGKCTRTVPGHTGPISCIGLSDSKMVTGSEDTEVRIYDFSMESLESGTCRRP